MAQRRAVREVAKKIRSLVSSQGPLEQASYTANKVPQPTGSNATSHPTGGFRRPSDSQSQAGNAAAWLLAAGGVTAVSAYTASASSTASPAKADKAAPAHAQENKVIFVLGGPGSGKGTQCAKIVEQYGFTHLSAGDLLRAEIKSGSEYGTMIQNMIKEGKIVPAEVTVGLLKKAMTESGNNKFLIDGFPRNAENREVFERDTGIMPEFILFFDCPEEVMEKRLLGRNQGRIDDNIETIRKRFRVFVEQSIPVVAHYAKLGKVLKIDATQTPDDVFKSYSDAFTRFIHEDLLKKSEELLKAIDTGDYASYSKLCDEALTCFEPESQGHLVEGLPFHEYYFKQHGAAEKKPAAGAPKLQSTIASPKVTVIGDVGIVTYTRLMQAPGNPKAGATHAMNETRIWKRVKDEAGNWVWKNIHLHRSHAPSV